MPEGRKTMFKIAIVGAGIIGKTHSETIYKNSECILVAVADIDELKAKEIAQLHGAECYTDYKKMAEEVEMDAVILNLPHFLHCEATIYFLEKGIDVLVEKPMANTVEECDRMIEAAKKSGAKLAVGHVQKYYPALRVVKEMISNETYGKLCMINDKRNSNYITPSRPKWFLKQELAGGGICMNYGAHVFDKLLYTTGRSVEKIHSVRSNPVSNDDVDANLQMLIEFSGGVSAVVTLCGSNVPNEWETSYHFTDGTVKVVGSRLYVPEDGKFVEYDLRKDVSLLGEQLEEFIKFLKGEESEIVTPEYGREIIKYIEKIVEKELVEIK